VAAGERAGEGDVGERDQLDGARELLGRDRLSDGSLEHDFSGEHGGEQERDPGVRLAAAQAGYGDPEGDATGDLGLTENADGRGEQVEPGRADGLHEIDQLAIEVAHRAERDENPERDEERREQGDADQR
jgi:hypothetical protein